MYHHHSGMGYLGESSNTPSCVVRFVWPYGGESVSLSGSFNAWTQWPMAPVEGRPTAFQIICRLPPGFHQYKFIVDGEWRHDEHQNHLSGNYGTVNALVVAGGHDHHTALVTPQTALGSDMDVDTEAFQRVVRLTDGSLHETFPRISDSDLEASRRRISAFLSNHTAYELLPSSGKVTALDVDLPVKQAFRILYEQGIPMAPLFDFRGHFVGMLSAVDFILIMKELRSHGINMTEEELETHAISAWKMAKSYIGGQVDKSERASGRDLVQAEPDLNLQDVALRILQNRVSTVPVLHSTSLDGAYPQLLHLTSLSDILKCICRYFGSSLVSLPMLQRPICVIPLGTWVPDIGQSNQRPLAALRPNACLTAALELLVQAQVSSIPIVDDNGTLLDIYSRSDITAMAKDRLFARINLDEITVHQALQLREESYLLLGRSQQSCQMCLPTDPVYTVMERLSKPGVRRLVIVEAGSKRVQGIVSISDVFRFLFGV